MLGILIAFVSPLLHGFANILDNYLSNTLFRNIWTLTFYSVFFNVLFLPLVFLIEIPHLPPIHLLPFFLLIALIEVLYLYPYAKALQHDDTSIVASLFSIGKIFVPVFAFLIVGEVLSVYQYLGFFIIVLSSALLTLNIKGVIRINKSFLFMLVCSVLLSIESVLYKYLFASVSWSTGFFWPTLFSFFMVLSLLCIPKQRTSIFAQLKQLRSIASILILEEFLTFGGSAASTYALSLIPVTLEKSIDSFQPLFVLLSAIVFHKFFPHLFRETIDRSSIIKKCTLFGFMIIGIVLVVS